MDAEWRGKNHSLEPQQRETSYKPPPLSIYPRIDGEVAS